MQCNGSGEVFHHFFILLSGFNYDWFELTIVVHLQVSPNKIPSPQSSVAAHFYYYYSVLVKCSVAAHLYYYYYSVIVKCSVATHLYYYYSVLVKCSVAKHLYLVDLNNSVWGKALIQDGGSRQVEVQALGGNWTTSCGTSGTTSRISAAIIDTFVI